MLSATQVLVSLAVILVSFFAYLYSGVIRARRTWNWIPQAPRVPFFGSIFEFRGLKRLLSDYARLLNNPQKMVYVEIANKWFILATNYDLMEFVLSSTSTSILDKSSDYDYFVPWFGLGLLTAPGPKWRKRRKIITPAFHFSILEQFVEIFESNSEVFIEKLKKEAVDKPKIDIDKYIVPYALDTISETAMGVKIDSQNNNNQDFVDAVQSFIRIALARSFSSWKGNDLLFKLSKDHKKQQQNLKILKGFTNSVIEKRKKELLLQNNKKPERLEEEIFGKKRKLAFLDLLLNCTIDGKPLSQEDIREEVDTFMFEGHDTTSSAVSSALFLLANHPEIQKTVREEQKEIFGRNRDRTATYQDLQDMKYLDLVIKETLRINPSVPLMGRVATEDINYKGHIIPKGTTITLFIYGINRDPDYHENPEEFKPERFLDSTSKLPYANIPFSAGPRNCIGQKFAMLEMKSIISATIRNFELHPTDPPHERFLAADPVLKSRNGVMLRIKSYEWE